MWVGKIAQCDVCGREYLKKGPKVRCCSEECRILLARQLRKQYETMHKVNRRREIVSRRQESTNRILREANASGLSYGKYVAYLAAKEETA